MIGEAEPLQARVSDIELEMLLEAIFLRYHQDFRGYARASLKPHLATYPSIKLWVAGCSTGEEAYSFAILLQEEGLLERTLIYATDISNQSLARAASGVYPLARMADFTSGYQRAGGRQSFSNYYSAAYGAATMARALKERMVFSDHSLSTDAAFTEVQLVSCRNVLIYFDRATQDPAVVRKSAERLRSIGTRMGRMITDLLDLARARLGGGIPVTARPTDFSVLVHRVVDELRLVHEGRELVRRIPEPTAGRVVGKWDADRLSQLVGNLVINAIEHGPREHPVVVTLSRTPTSAILSVANHGQIPPELLGQLFDPFRSGAARRETATGGGLGLGLYIVQQIAVAHGGTVSASSEGGTVTFTARLPLAREPPGNPGGSSLCA